MPKVAIRVPEQSEPCSAPQGSSAGVETRAYFDGDKHPIHLRVHHLDPGARLVLNAEESDLSVYVWKGSGLVGGTTMDERSSAVVQYGATLEFTSADSGAALLEFSTGERPRASRSGELLLLPGPSVPRTEAMGGTEGIGGALHADAHEPTPDIWLHENDYAVADKETALHSHSEDEVIFVRSGSVRLGNRLFGPGTALAIAANTLYGFFSGPDGLSFVNFRASSPTYRTADGSMILDEAELWRGAVGRPRFVAAVTSA